MVGTIDEAVEQREGDGRRGRASGGERPRRRSEPEASEELEAEPAAV